MHSKACRKSILNFTIKRSISEHKNESIQVNTETNTNLWMRKVDNELRYNENLRKQNIEKDVWQQKNRIWLRKKNKHRTIRRVRKKCSSKICKKKRLQWIGWAAKER